MFVFRNSTVSNREALKEGCKLENRVTFTLFLVQVGLKVSMDSKKIKISVGGPYEDGPMKEFDDLFSELKKNSEQQALINAKNPRYKRFPEGFDAVCRDFLINDSWTLSEAAHLIAGYVPGRGVMPKGDSGKAEIDKVEYHLKRAINVVLRPVHSPMFGLKRFATKDLLNWGHSKDFTLAPVLLECIKPSLKTVKPKAERADTRDRKEAQEEALRYYKKIKHKDGRYPVRSKVVTHLCKNMDFLTVGIDETRVTRWVKDIDPERELKQQRYGVKG